MTTQPVEANVVLTADNSAYDQAMMQSAGSTNQLGKSLDSLGQKIDRLTKSAGKKLLGITAADVAVITGATAAWASYEKQMSRLQAQAAITTRSTEGQTKVMKQYTESVTSLRKEFGTTTSEAAELTQAISKMTDQTRPIRDLAHTFEMMSKATGESSSGLATSLLNLQKMMGTPQSATKEYADQLTYLAASSNTTATALADFSSQIAPLGRAMGMTQTEVVGFSNMFIKAGQDGYTAATAFNKITQDITQAVQTSSPDLNKYANILGLTVEQFKGLGASEQVARFFDQIARLGPRASQELNRFGFDGIRMSKAITGAVQSSGGAMNAIREAQIGYGSDATTKGAEAAHTMTDTLAKLRQELQLTAEAFGSAFGPGLDKVLSAVEFFAGKMQDLMDGPFGKFLQAVSAILVPVTALAGGLLLMATTITKVAAAFLLLRNSGSLGLMEGLRGGARIVPGGPMGFQAAGEGSLGPRGAQIAEGGTWFQRGTYNVGQAIGSGGRAGGRALGGLPLFAAGAPGEPRMISRLAGRGVTFTGEALRSQFDQTRFPNPADRMQMFGRYFPGTAPGTAEKVFGAQAGVSAAEEQAGYARQRYQNAMTTPGISTELQDKTKKQAEVADKALDAAKELEAEHLKMAAAEVKTTAAVTQAGRTQISVSQAVAKESGLLAKALAGATASAAKFGASAAGMGLKTAGRGLMGAMGGPWGMGITAAMMAPIVLPMLGDLLGIEGEEPYEFTKLGRPGEEYAGAGGAPLPTAVAAPPVTASQKFQTVASSKRITDEKVQLATAASHKLSNKNLYNLNEKEVTNYLGSNFSVYKDDPDAISMMVLDLIDKFDVPTATRIIDNLYSGNFEQGPAPFYAAAGDASGARKKKLLDMAAAIASEQELMAGVGGGPTAAGGARARNLAADLRLTLGAEGRVPKDVLESFNQTYGLGISSTDLEKMRLGGVMGKKPEPEFGAKFGEGVEFGTKGKEPPTFGAQYGVTTSPLKPGASDAETIVTALEELPKEQSDAIKTSLNIPLELSGKELTKAVEKLVAAGEGEPVKTPEELMAERVSSTGRMGALLMDDKAVQAALGFNAGNLRANMEAADSFMAQARELGMSAPQVIGSMQKIRSEIGEEGQPASIIASIVQQREEQIAAIQRPMMTRGQGFAQDVAMFQEKTATLPTTDEQKQEQADAFANMAASLTDQVQTLRQMYHAQIEFDKQRQRAQEDYNLSRQYAEYDFNLQRTRAEMQYNRMRTRATQDFHRNQARATADYNLGRKRQEDDFNHSIEVQAKQQAQTVMDIYTRVKTERTSSAEWILSNATDQLKRMQEQSANLDILREKGLSDTAIQQLGLTSPDNAQQLARFITEVTPELIAQFNKTAGTERIKAAKELVSDPSSLEWQELTRNQRISMSRNAEDFERGMKRNTQDFRRGMKQQKDDFDLMMSQQLEDYKTGMDRQEDAFGRQMRRAAKDFSDTAREMDMDLETLLTKGANKFKGHMLKQVEEVKTSLTALKETSAPEAVALMQTLADIFGFEYKVPKSVSDMVIPQMVGQAQSQHMQGELAALGRAQGGVLPGWSPGKDNMMVPLSGGEAIMRPEWARAVGEKNIEAMNHQARHGGYALGGGVPATGDVSQHPTSAYPWARWAGDINQPGSGDYGNPVRAWKKGTVADVVYLGDTSYGRYIKINHPDTNEQTLYAHLSAASVKGGDEVTRGQQIGNVGDLGNTTGPHLHFEIKGGTGAIDVGASSIGGMIAQAALSGMAMKALKKLYPQSENAAWNMRGVHPFGKGQFSSIINRFAKQKIQEMGIASQGTSGLSDPDLTVPPAPDDLDSNQETVRKAMLQAGFNANQWDALYQLVQHESGFNNKAQNPTSTAYGLFQFLDGTWAGVDGKKTSDAWMQSVYGMRYIKNRYKNPKHAWEFWQDNNWYGDGAVFNGPQTIGVGESGPEAVIPLNARGGEFMADVMSRSVGMGSTPVGGNVYNTKVDKSTNFTGPITVQANNPEELLTKLQARQRVMALSRPSLTGSAA